MKTNQYIIGSLQNGDTSLSVSHQPRPHDNIITARNEAVRLARMNPGTRYVVLEIKGVVEAQGITWS